MKIAIIGTRGIPNFYGGFEQFAEYFSVYAASKGNEVYVYNSSLHPYQEKTYKNVTLIHCKDYENILGTAGQFFYDLHCILDARKRSFDVILQLGYTSSSIWYKLLPKKAVIVTNMDGLEWKRSKYSNLTKKFLSFAENLAVRSSDYLIADSKGIEAYLKKRYAIESTYIAYGATLFKNPSSDLLTQYNCSAYAYNMLLARMEPENNIEMILDGVASSTVTMPFLVIGSTNNTFGTYLKDKYKAQENIRFLEGVYNIEHLNNLRYYSNLYFHGHSVGGTNPSLLEAMASHSLIIAHHNEFNQSILEEDGFYFNTKEEVSFHIENTTKEKNLKKVAACMEKIKTHFDWDIINKSYLDFLNNCVLLHSKK
ncbi:MAG: DUF1972 domain-containing protein [Flavobacteriaceae bacterium]